MPCALTGIDVHINAHMGDWNDLEIAISFSGDFNVSDFQHSLQSFLTEYNENPDKEYNEKPEKNKCKLIEKKKSVKKIKEKKNVIISTAFDGMEVI